MPDNLDRLLTAIDYKFKNIELLEIALTHSSYLNENNLKKSNERLEFLEIALTHSSYLNENNLKKSNERLEFLGDSVLDLVIGEYLFSNFKNFREGSLSKIRALIVNRNSLYKIALKISLGNYMKLGKGELKNKGNLNESILADCLEALIGAVYLDGGLDSVKKVITILFEDIILRATNKKTIKDYKSILQEYVQKSKMGNLSYVLYDSLSKESNIFKTKVTINDNIIGRGYGKNKKKSQQMAARDALVRLGELDV